MKAVRGVRPDPRGTGTYQVVISDPFQGKQRRFHFATQAEATTRKLDITAKIKAIQTGTLTVPENVVDIVLWLVRGKKGIDTGRVIATTPVSEVIDSFVAHQKSRATTPCEDGICLGRFQVYERQMRRFQAFCEKEGARSITSAVSGANLEKYKTELSEHYKSKASVLNAANVVTVFVAWAWETNRINDLPRNLRAFAKVTVPDPIPKVFTEDEVKTLYFGGRARIRLYILLALNAGYTQMDIADLRHTSVDWEAGTIDEFRGKVIKKAEVPRKVKLWPSTLAALKLFATEPSQNDRVLLTEKGNPIVWYEMRDHQKTVVSRADSVQQLFASVMKPCGIEGRSFKHFRKTGASLIKNHYLSNKMRARTNSELFDMYLAHKPPKMARPYDIGDWTELHEATDWMGNFLGLFDEGILEGSG